MLRHIGGWFARLDSVYKDRPYFNGLKARLLAAFQAVLCVLLPLNFIKICLTEPPGLGYRLAVNVIMMMAALFSWHRLRKGRLEAAGDGLVLLALLPIHGVLVLVPEYREPLASTVQVFVFDFMFLTLALFFASRRVAVATLVVIMAGLVHMRLVAFDLPQGSLGSPAFVADTLLRDGLIAIGVLFCLGWTLMAMIEATHRRSEEALRATIASKQDLELLVSERTRDLEAATARANEASQAKGDFLANMSHEIRTPLNGIIASAELLRQREGLPSEAAEDARLIGESGELLLRLLGDILDFSKIEAGQLVLEPRPFSPATAAADASKLFSAQARRAGVVLGVSIPAAAPLLVGDDFRLRQILVNLLSNAIKFTPRGGRVDIAVETDDPAADPVNLRIRVRDTGIGMDPGTLARVFQRFTQADSSTTRRFGGTGLGLSITSRLVELMGGRLEAESVPGQGSVFTCHLSLPRPAESGSRAPLVAEAPPALGLDVLVVEDNAVNRKVLVAQLAGMGCRCTTVPDGQAFLELIQGEAPLPDVVLMDCHMPGLDGWEATRRLRAWAADASAAPRLRLAGALPVVAVTAAVLPEDQERCRQSGMNGFVPKPVKVAALRAALGELRVRAA